MADRFIREIQERYDEYLPKAPKQISVERGKEKVNTYICPVCGNGSGSDGTGMNINPNGDGVHFYCHKCHYVGDGIDAYEKQHNISNKQAIDELAELLHIDKKAYAEGKIIKREPPKKEAEPPKDYTKYLELCASRITEPAARDYLKFRGISIETAEKFHLGYEPSTLPEKWQALVIPTSKNSYALRNMDRKAGKSDRYRKRGSVTPFNFKVLEEAEAGAPVFVTEGELNALSIIEVGGKAAAAGSAGNVKEFLQYLKEHPTKATLLIAGDSDANGTGQNAAQELAEGLQRLNTRHAIVDIGGGYNDPNERLQDDREGLKAAVAEAIAATIAPDNVKTYVQSLMAGELQNFRQGAQRKTGFANLDAKAGGIYNGLYILAAASSLGKTTFMLQIADQLAAAGEHVLFFSMEQSRLELVSKSFARLMAQDNERNALSSIEIRTMGLTPGVLKAADKYIKTIGNRLSIIEGNYKTTVQAIGTYVADYIERTGTKPVVIIDYLQVIQGTKTGIREQLEDTVVELKRISRKYDIPVFGISSTNRSSYLTPISFESLKETGLLEFTADVVWGLQFVAVNETLFEDETKNKVAKRKKIEHLREEPIRDLELVCLKNRFGVGSFKVAFTYFCENDCFVPAKVKSNFDEQQEAQTKKRRAR